MTPTSPRRPPTSVFNLPNQLTAARLVLAFVLFGLIHAQAWASCLVVFALAALTDWLDGYLARLQGLSSALGRMFDPLVDKVLMCGTFIFLLPEGTRNENDAWLTPWMVTVVVARELIITGLRNYLEMLHVQFGADWLGKLKMGLQCAAVVAIFVVQGLAPTNELYNFCSYTRNGLIYAMLVATVLSGLQYVWRAAMILRNDAEKAL
jgi:CDP-diacylglycerol--glycerol-3-phosphate 3-phosphatidyltransferase